jgi:hypothetical protein
LPEITKAGIEVPMMRGDLFEEKFVELLVAEVEALKLADGVSYREFAARAWPEIESPQNKWQRIKNISEESDKRQNVTLGDAYCLVSALGQDLARFIVRVLDAVERAPQLSQTASGTGHIQVGGSVGGSISSEIKKQAATDRRRKKPSGRRRH